MANIRTECPLCKKMDWNVLYRLGKFNIVQCRSCSLIFRDIYLTAESSKELYSKSYFTDEQADYFFNYPEAKEELFRDRAKTLQPYISKNGRLLDIGCAIGTFLKIARECGWDTKGVETSEYAAGYARDKYALDVICGEFKAEKFSDGDKFDAVTMWDVVDHPEDPIVFLKDAVSVLKKGGYLFVETTMEDSLVYEICGYVYTISFGLIKGPVMKGHPIHHSIFFSRSTLRKALESCGMEIKAVMLSKYPSQFFPGGFLSKFVFNLFYILGNRLGRPLMVTFVAQKTG